MTIEMMLKANLDSLSLQTSQVVSKSSPSSSCRLMDLLLAIKIRHGAFFESIKSTVVSHISLIVSSNVGQL